MTMLFKKFFLLLSLFFITANAEYIGSYTARLGDADHYNSSGVRLHSAAAIIRQDRYNYHVRHIRQSEDRWDPFFNKKYNRDALESMLRNGRASRRAIRKILYGTPLIKVDIYTDHINVKVIDDGSTAAGSSEKIATYYARLAEADHYNSSGIRLSDAAAIIRQDRYNYHIRHIRQREDTWDPFFRKKYNRDALERMLRNGTASPSALRAILYGHPLIKVDIYTDHINVKVISGSESSLIR